MEKDKTDKEILEEALRKFAPDSSVKLTEFIINRPDTDLITFNQVKEIIQITKLKKLSLR